MEPSIVRWIHQLGHALALLAGTAVVALMLLTVIDVARRRVTGGGIRGTVEITEVMLVVVVFAGMMSAEASQVHIRTSLVIDRLPVRAAHATRFLGLVIVTTFVAWLAYLTWKVGIESFQKREFKVGLVDVAVWPGKLMIPLAFTGLVFEFVSHGAKTVDDFIRRAPIEKQLVELP